MEEQSKEVKSASGTPNETTTHVQIPQGSSKEMTVTDENNLQII